MGGEVTRAQRAARALFDAKLEWETARVYELAIGFWAREQIAAAQKHRTQAARDFELAAARFGYEADRENRREGRVWASVEAQVQAARD